MALATCHTLPPFLCRCCSHHLYPLWTNSPAYLIVSLTSPTPSTSMRQTPHWALLSLFLIPHPLLKEHRKRPRSSWVGHNPVSTIIGANNDLCNHPWFLSILASPLFHSFVLLEVSVWGTVLRPQLWPSSPTLRCGPVILNVAFLIFDSFSFNWLLKLL